MLDAHAGVPLFSKKIIFQVADVHKPLLSVTRAADAGFDILLAKEGGCLTHRPEGNECRFGERAIST